MAGGVRRLVIEIAGDAKGAASAFKDASDASDGLSEKSSKVGTAVKAGFATAGAAVLAFGLSAIGKVSEVAEGIDSLQDITGESAESMSHLQYAFQSWNISADDTQAMLLKLSKAVGAGAAEFKQYGIATTDAAGHTLPMSQIVANTADAFQKMPDGIDKADVAMKLFGKSGTDVLDVLNGGSAGLKALGAEADKYGITLSQKGVDAQQQYAKAQRQMSAAWEGLQIQLGQVLMPILAKLASWFADEIPKAIGFVKAAIEALSPVFDVLGAVISAAFSVVSAAFGFLIDHREIMVGAAIVIGIALFNLFTAWAVEAGAAAIATLAAVWPLIAIGAAVAALAAGIIYAYNHFAVFRDIVGAVGRFFTDTLWPALKSVFDWLTTEPPKILGAVGDFFVNLGHVAQTVWSAITTGVKAAWDAVTGAITTSINAVGSAVKTGWDAVSSASRAVWDTITGIVQKAWDTVTGLVRGGVGAVKTAWNDLTSATSTAWDAIFGRVKNIVGKISDLADTIGDAFKSAWDGVTAAFKTVWNALAGIWNSTVGKISIHIPMTNIGFDVPDLPLFAGGGVLTRATALIAGEYPGAGSNPEIVTPQNIMRDTFNESLRGFREAPAGMSGSVYVQNVVNVTVEGSVTAEAALIDRIQASLQQTSLFTGRNAVEMPAVFG